MSAAGNGLVVLGGSGGLVSTSITANGNPTGGSVTWTPGPNLQIGGVNSVNSSVSGTAPSTSAGDTYVSVKYTVNGQSASASVRFTVLKPTTLQPATSGGSQATVPYVSGNNKGYITTITYYLYDQMSPANIIALPGLTFTEVLTTTSDPKNIDFIPPDGTPNTIRSNSIGQLPDLLYAYLPGGLPSSFTASRSQSLTGNGYPFSPTQQQSYATTAATISVLSLHR